MSWQALNLTDTCPTRRTLTACTPFGFIFLNTLVNLYGDSYDRRIQQEIGYNNEPGGADEEQYDFIVVGAGSAGCIVANRLSAVSDLKVLLLEAGPEQPDVTLIPGLSPALLGSKIDYGYSTMPDGKSCLARENGRCPWPRGKVMGGSSSVNSFVYIRGNRVDYDDWAAMGNDGWSYEEVLPYFKKSENNLEIDYFDEYYHGRCGEQPIRKFQYVDEPSRMLEEAFLEKGLPYTDFNSANQHGTAQAQVIVKEGVRFSTNNAFIQPIRYNRNNLVVRLLSEAVKILIDNNQRAYGVNYLRNEILYTAIAKKEVIVSAGSINSPKLLMLSGIGLKEHLKELGIPVIKDLSVGENLHDHVTLTGMVIALPNKTATTVSDGELLKQVVDFYDTDVVNNPLSGNGPVSALGFIHTQPALPAPDISISISICSRLYSPRG